MVRRHLTIRPVEPEDLPFVDELMRLGFGKDGGRPQPPAGALPAGEIRYVAASDDAIVGFGAARSYGVAAYVGPLVVHPNVRRRGIASDLLHALARALEHTGARTLLLDATDENAPLYERFGFAAIDETDVYERPARGDSTRSDAPITDDTIAHALEIDRRIAGCDRAATLSSFARESTAWLALRASGYIFARGRALGPWLADDAATAAELLTAVLDARPALYVAYVPRSNRAAPAILHDAGFALDRSLRHLAYGAPSPMQRDRIYGQASLGHG